MTAPQRRLPLGVVVYGVLMAGAAAWMVAVLAGPLLSALAADVVGVVLFLAVSWFFLRRVR